jgi:hypothetical protein
MELKQEDIPVHATETTSPSKHIFLFDTKPCTLPFIALMIKIIIIFYRLKINHMVDVRDCALAQMRKVADSM